MTDTIDLLIDILFDPTAREDEKHDAVMDLGEYNDERALQALLKVASNFTETEIILQSAGESIGRIWTESNQFDKNAFAKLHPFAQHEAEMYIKAIKPELWVLK